MVETADAAKKKYPEFGKGGVPEKVEFMTKQSSANVAVTLLATAKVVQEIVGQLDAQGKKRIDPEWSKEKTIDMKAQISPQINITVNGSASGSDTAKAIGKKTEETFFTFWGKILNDVQAYAIRQPWS